MAPHLTKLLALFIYPLGAAILVGATALVLSFTNWRRIGQVVLGCALLALWIAATPVFANWINWRMESRIPAGSPDILPQSDAIILLGGTPISRILRALHLYRSGKAPYIVITGGNPAGQEVGVSEAQRVANFLVEIGAPSSALILETESSNTRENAVNTATIFKQRGWRQGLLVTDGVHMPRALATFEQVGLNVTPAAADPRSSSIKADSLLDYLPHVEALAWTTATIKEMIGLCVYRYRGWA